jgi:FkbM family methyltransferase
VISYAQNREDVVLARAFAGRRKGFYIDVGAEDPTAFSVTKHFYDLGWRGINVEPTRSAFAELERERPEDVNLAVGLADFVGTATLFEGPPENHGASTFDAHLADELAAHGFTVRPVAEVPITTLAHVCKEWVGDREIDILKIDVEGWERAVIDGGDWDRWRPKVVVVEATIPHTGTPSHDDWEPTLLEAGYVCTLFDGLNRFYCLADLPELHGPLSVPANVFDDAVDFRVAYELRALREQLDLQRDALDRERHDHATVENRCRELESELELRREERAATALELDELRRDLAAGQRDLASSRDDLRHERREHHLVRERVGQLEEEIALQDIEAVALRQRAAEEHSARVRIEREVAAVRATKTFRWTKAARVVYARLRGRSL